MLTGLPPFQSQSEYLIFQKIQKLEYSFHEGFDEHAKDLIKRLLVIEPSDRIGARDSAPYSSIRSHPFFEGRDFERLHDETPPCAAPFLPPPGETLRQDACWTRGEEIAPGAGNLTRLLLDDDDGQDAVDARTGGNGNAANELRLLGIDSSQQVESAAVQEQRNRNIVNLSDEERRTRLEEQIKTNKFHQFVRGNLILKQGILDKKKGLWARRRMFLLTEGPHLYYVDPDHMVLKGEIPWSETIRPEPKDFKVFFVHTPNRVYYLIDPGNENLRSGHRHIAPLQSLSPTYGATPSTKSGSSTSATSGRGRKPADSYTRLLFYSSITLPVSRLRFACLKPSTEKSHILIDALHPVLAGSGRCLRPASHPHLSFKQNETNNGAPRHVRTKGHYENDAMIRDNDRQSKLSVEERRNNNIRNSESKKWSHFIVVFYIAGNWGNSLLSTTLLSTPSSVMMASLAHPPELPSRLMASVTQLSTTWAHSSLLILGFIAVSK